MNFDFEGRFWNAECKELKGLGQWRDKVDSRFLKVDFGILNVDSPNYFFFLWILNVVGFNHLDSGILNVDFEVLKGIFGNA